MAYYDQIARQWHRITGYRGGPLKELLLNDAILARCPSIEGLRILELGAGNGYFMPLVLRRFSGQTAARIVVTDQSRQLMQIAERSFRVGDAEYQLLDIRNNFPFGDEAFDLVLTTMVFNEVSDRAFRHAVAECHRVLRNGGQMLATVLHPAFVDSLAKRRLLRRDKKGRLSMPGACGIRLPIATRSVATYENSIADAGFGVEAEEIHATPALLSAKPGLKEAGQAPLALILDCRK